MEMTGKTILVTGGAGAIGGRLAGKLSHYNDVIVLDNLSSGYMENVPIQSQFVDGDITDSYHLEHLFENNEIDMVFHLAAFFANQNSIDHPIQDLSTNGIGTLNLLELSLKYEVKKFIYASSSCVNGESKITPYAITKQLGEEYVGLYNRLHGLDTVILRYYNSYGPGDRSGKYRSVIPNFIKKALNDEDIIITGTGEETRDFTFVDDIIDATILASCSNESNGIIFDVGSGKETKIIDLAIRIKQLTDSKSDIVFSDNRKWDTVKNRVANIDAAHDLLGYYPLINLDEGLEKTIQWMRNENA